MQTRSPLDALASGLMLVLCMVWSLQQISLKAAAAEISPMLMVALRSGVAAALVLAWTFVRGEQPRLASGRWRAGLLVGGLFALEYLLVSEALRLTHASRVVVFLYTAPIFAALGLHWKLAAERLQPLQWLGIGVAFVGIATAFLDPGAPATPHALWGDLLALLAGAAWGMTTIAIRFSRLSAAPASETLFYQLLAAFVLLLPLAFVRGQAQFAPSALGWAHLGFQTLVVSFASFLVWFWLLRHYLATPLGVFAFLTPVLGLALGIWLLNEPLNARFVGGSALVLAGVLLVNGHAWLPARLSGQRAS